MGRSFDNLENDKVNPEDMDVKENEIKSYVNNIWKKDNEDISTVEGEGDGIKKIICRNQCLEGKEHPETGVRYERKVITVDGEKIEGVFPHFESKFDTKLPEELYNENDDKQSKYCMRQLKESIQNDPELAKQFETRQYQQIMDGNARVSGYIWHHKEDQGEMQLIEMKTHQKTGHTGGRKIWGREAQSADRREDNGIDMEI